MRISDWSSDVCSSDLLQFAAVGFQRPGADPHRAAGRDHLAGLAAGHGRGAFVDAAAEPVVVVAVDDHAVAGGAHLGVGGDGGVVVALELQLLHLQPAVPALARDRLAGGVELPALGSAEERRVGKGWVSVCSTRGSPYHEKK